MGKRRFGDLPESTTAWVKATILGAGLTGAIACGPSQEEVAPTCGPCCHGGGPDCEMMQTEGDEVVHDVEADQTDDALYEEEPDEIVEEAPTCGPCCHGGGPDCD